MVIRQKLTRAQLLKFFEKPAPCLVGIEACGTAHHFAHELITLGHDVRMMEVPDVGPLLASALVGTIADPKAFRTGRNLAAWIGPVHHRTPAAASSGSAGSRSRGIAIGDRCWSSVPWRSCATRCGTARVGRGWPSCSRDEHRMSQPSHSPTRPLRPRQSADADELRKGGQAVVDSQSIPEGRKTQQRQSALSARFRSGPAFAEGIMASGHAYRTNRSNTWPHRPAQRNIRSSLPTGSCLHMAQNGLRWTAPWSASPTKERFDKRQ